MLRLVLIAVYAISTCHMFLGLMSICLGVVSSIQAEVWLAHKVSPIWSGSFFLITGILGICCAKKKTSYVILCFTAFSVVSMVTAVVSIQLLRLGLVNHTTDGHTFQKKDKDIIIIMALVVAGTECLVCIMSSLISCRMAKVAKEELCKRREGMFHVKEKEVPDENKTSISHDNNDTSSSRHTCDWECNAVQEQEVEIDLLSIPCSAYQNEILHITSGRGDSVLMSVQWGYSGVSYS
ncbi:hypothetical protein ScPMuIL_013535 [Solemya velum]